MIVHGKQLKYRKRISKLKIAIDKAIDEICEEEEYDITYTEINAAMLECMKGHNSFELKELMNSDDEDDGDSK
jgi:hypothetical protein